MGTLQETQHLDIFESEMSQFVTSQAAKQSSTKNSGKPKEILLLGENALRRLEINSYQNSYILGRFTESYRFTNYVDLSVFGGQDLGVSRIHAQILMEGNEIRITDLNSKNGTYYAGLRLEPNQPVVLQSGTTIRLGRLQVQMIINTLQSGEIAS